MIFIQVNPFLIPIIAATEALNISAIWFAPYEESLPYNETDIANIAIKAITGITASNKDGVLELVIFTF